MLNSVINLMIRTYNDPRPSDGQYLSSFIQENIRGKIFIYVIKHMTQIFSETLIFPRKNATLYVGDDRTEVLG